MEEISIKKVEITEEIVIPLDDLATKFMTHTGVRYTYNIHICIYTCICICI